MLIELSLFALVALIIWLVGKPLYAIIVLKIQFGKYAYVSFSPIKGFFHLQEESLRKHGDVMAEYRQIIQQRPETKFVISNIFNIPLILLVDPDYSKYVYTEHNNFTKFNYVGKQNIICEGIVFADGPDWRRQKGILAEAFTFQKVKGRIPLIEQLTKQKLNTITDPRNVNMQDTLMQIAGEIVMKCFFGMEYDIIRLENGQELQAAICHLIADLAFMVKTNGIFQLKQFIFGELCWKYFASEQQKALQKQIQNIMFTINKIVEERISNPLDNDDFLNLNVKEYLKPENKISKVEINQQFITLLLGGTDTSANQTCISLYYLALYPEIQDDLYQEILSLGDDTLNADNLQKLEKMTSFLQEILRYRGVGQVITPRIPKYPLKINDLKIQSNWMVTPFFCMTQYNPRNYNNPLEFNYKRFYRQNPIKSESSFVNVPFSGGARTCIGMHMAMIEMKIFLTLILKKYRIIINNNVKPLWKHDMIYNIHPTNCYYLENRFQ